MRRREPHAQNRSMTNPEVTRLNRRSTRTRILARDGGGPIAEGRRLHNKANANSSWNGAGTSTSGSTRCRSVTAAQNRGTGSGGGTRLTARCRRGPTRRTIRRGRLRGPHNDDVIRQTATVMSAAQQIVRLWYHRVSETTSWRSVDGRVACKQPYRIVYPCTIAADARQLADDS